MGPTAKTLGRRCKNAVQMFCVCWVIAMVGLYEGYRHNHDTISDLELIVTAGYNDRLMKRSKPAEACTIVYL